MKLKKKTYEEKPHTSFYYPFLHFFTACSEDAEPFSLNRTSATLVIGDTLHLFANVSNVTWSSSTDAISVVDGMVIADSIGIALITATTEDGYTATCGIAVVATQRGCNFNTPGWGNYLGTISFHTNQTWTIEGNNISQIWSDAVTATNCRKTTFSGGSSNNFNADCRSNPNFPGDLFSWCAVVRFADQLCPYPWRVPTTEDFRDLDIAMGGTGSPRVNLNFVNTNYIQRWGGRFGGNSGSRGTLFYQSFWGDYWSQSEMSAVYGRPLVFGAGGSIIPQSSVTKAHGLTLRCVR